MKNKYFFILFLFLLAKPIFAQDQYIGEVRLFANGFAPKGWAKCEGQLIPIQTNIALFSILGVTYGGDGRNTFALPDLRDRMAVGAGEGTGLSQVYLGQNDGSTSTTLNQTNLPAHTHTFDIKVSSATGNSSVPSSSSSLAAPVKVLNSTSRPVAAYNTATPDITLSNITISPAGSSIAVPIGQPVLSSNYYIALQGTWPQRP